MSCFTLKIYGIIPTVVLNAEKKKEKFIKFYYGRVKSSDQRIKSGKKFMY